MSYHIALREGNYQIVVGDCADSLANFASPSSVEECMRAMNRATAQLRDRVAALVVLVHQIDLTLRVPAAEYVPAISDVFTLIDGAGLREPRP